MKEIIYNQIQALDTLPDYYQFYLKELKELVDYETSNVNEALALTYEKTLEVFSEIYEGYANYAYHEGKWTIIEVVGHLIDVERIFAYRALRIARGEKENFSGFDENEYVIKSNYHLRDFNQVKQESLTVFESTGYLFEGFTKEELAIMGKASGFDLNPRTIGFVTAAHRNHHLNILRERYLKDN